MVEPVVEVQFGELFRADDQQVLGILLLSGSGEIEGAGDHDRPVDEDDLVVGDGMLGINVGGDAGVHEKGERRVSLVLLTLVEDHLYLDPSPVCLEQGVGDRSGGEGVSLDEDLRPSPIDLPYDGRGASVLRAEIDLDRREMTSVDVNGAGRRAPEEHSGEQNKGADGKDRDKTIRNGPPDAIGLDYHL